MPPALNALVVWNRLANDEQRKNPGRYSGSSFNGQAGNRAPDFGVTTTRRGEGVPSRPLPLTREKHFRTKSDTRTA